MPVLAVWSLLGFEIFTKAALVTIGIVGGSIYYQSTQAKKLESRSFKAQTEAARRKAIAEGRERAIQQAPISAEQMKLVMGAQEIEGLIDKFYEQDQAGPVIYYLPTAEPTSPIERFNRAIDDFFWA